MKSGCELQIKSGKSYLPISAADVVMVDSSGKIYSLGELSDMILSQEKEIQGLRELIVKYQKISGTSVTLLSNAVDLISVHDKEHDAAIADLKQSISELKGIQEDK